MRLVLGFLLALWLPALTGCQSGTSPQASRAGAEEQPEHRPETSETGITIHIVSNGWHTGIVLARADIPESAVPEVRDFPQADFFEFSWGDARYFPAPEKGLGMIMSALFTPTPAVMHLAGLPTHPTTTFPTAETVSLQLSPEGFDLLVSFLDETFDRDAGAQGKPGLYPFSRFYPAKGRFHMFNTCNTWTARGLAAAGVPVKVNGTLQAEALMAQLR